MMPLLSEHNLYPGVNAHLNSFLQITRGAWRSFHSEQIVDLGRLIRRNLPSGYVAAMDQSLQITAFDDDLGIGQEKQLVSDVTIYEQAPVASTTASAKPTTAHPSVLSLSLTQIIDLPDDEDGLSGVTIYQAGEGTGLGRPITRFELLSAANKPGGSGYAHYEAKRAEALKAGLRLVEIDYLHHRASVIPVLPRYGGQSQGAYPYMITIHDPRPTPAQGTASVYGIGVDQAIPTLNVPLAGADHVAVDFGAAYNTTFENSPFVSVAVDYAVDPPAFDKFTPNDQAKIRTLLGRIRVAFAQ